MTPAETDDLLQQISECIDRSPTNHGRDPEALLWGRVAKVSEEAGEVIEALIAVLGHNPRKGYHDTFEHVEYELLDVATGALLGLAHLATRGGQTDQPHFLERLADHIRTVAGLYGFAEPSTSQPPGQADVVGVNVGRPTLKHVKP